MDNKISVKFENGLYEQIFKFRDSDEINSLNDIQALVDDTFINTVLAEMSTLHNIKISALQRFLPDKDEDGFDDII